MSDPFANFAAGDVADLVTEHPFAWVCARSGGAATTALLPLLGEYVETGKLVSLLGHAPRRFPLIAALAADPRALILFTGPHGYLSPEDAGRRDWAPTWNFAQLSIEADVEMLPQETGPAVEALVAAMEKDRRDPWDMSAIAHRSGPMLDAIIGFRAHVTRLEGRFKLGQDENDATLETLVNSIGDTPLAQWMRRFAARRG